MSETDKTCIQCTVAFTRKRVGVHFFFKSLGTTDGLEFSDFPFIFMLSFLHTFQNNLNYAPISNIPEVIKLYNLGDESFETDFRKCRFSDMLSLIM